MKIGTRSTAAAAAAQAPHPALAIQRQRTPGEPLKLGKQHRFFPASDITLERKEDGTRMTLTASSESEVQRWWGTEVLSHEPGAIRMQRFEAGAVPVLFNHKYDVVVGMVEAARVKSRRLVVDIRFNKTDDARKVEQMVDGGLRNVSIGYQIHAVTEEKKEQRYTAVDWEPFEVSIVSVPADATVGIGRSDEGEAIEVRIEPAASEPTQESEAMFIGNRSRLQDRAGADGSAGGAAGTGAPGNVQVPAGTPQAAIDAAAGAAPATRNVNISAGPSAAEMEAGRIKAIDYFVQANNISPEQRNQWVTSGASLEQVGADILSIVGARNKAATPAAHVGLSKKEIKQFSIARAIDAVCNGHNWSKAGLEAEASAEIMRRMGFQPDPNKFYVPLEVQRRELATPVEELAYALMKRDLNTATGGGSFLIETANISFVELLRNRSVAFSMGATRMPGMVGNFTIPKQSAAGTAFWLANETNTITESNQTFVQIACSPKTVGGYTEISRQLLLQSSPAAEGLVMADLAAIVSLAADLAILNGSGAGGQPTGILNTAGIGSVTGTSLDYADIVEFQTDTAASNALFGDSGYVTTPAVAGLLKTRMKATNTWSPIWEGQLLDGRVDGYRGMASNQIPSASMLFGYFASVLVPEWGVLGIEINPFANFQAGIVGVRAMYSMDVGVRYPTAFSAANTIT